MNPLAPAGQPPETMKDTATPLANRHRLEARQAQFAKDRTVPFPFWSDGEGLRPQPPAWAMGAAMPARVGGGEMVAGMGQFVQQGNLQQFDFLAHLQTDAERFGAAVEIAAKQANSMTRANREAAEPIDQEPGRPVLQLRTDPAHKGLPDLEVAGHRLHRFHHLQSFCAPGLVNL
jgi:hypothetical protein